MSVTDPRVPSIDLRTTKAKAKKKGADGQERLAHRGCNTGKGAKDPVVPWPEHLFVVDPAVILTAVERLERKGGREVMRSEEHTSELQSLMRISYAVFCLKKKNQQKI